jgi:hypothetical protein
MFEWLRERRRRKILEAPFPDTWRAVLEGKVVHYRYLSEEKKTRLEQMVQVFIAEKNFEGLGGLDMSDEIRVVIAAQACILILELSHDLYRKVDSILVYPSAVRRPKRTMGSYVRSGVIEETSAPLLGEAHMGGPVILVWDAVKRGAIHPERGHNVVYHEFAHKLDMLDGAADGAPPLHTKAQYTEWADVCTREFETLSRKTTAGIPTFLDAYGATNPAEFFAVATEYFFDNPDKMKRRHSELYDILAAFYNQDTAARVKRRRR